MKRGLICTIAFIILTMASVTTTLAQIQLKQAVPVSPVTPVPVVPSGPGPYYPIPSWDQKLPVDSRFLILSDWGGAAVLDKETGLVWERSPSLTKFPDWTFAKYHCINLTLGNRKGWRLPTLQELSSILDPSIAIPGLALSSGHPFMHVQLGWYWSTTIHIENSSNAYAVRLVGADTGPMNKSSSIYAWCVRGGQGVNPQ